MGDDLSRRRCQYSAHTPPSPRVHAHLGRAGRTSHDHRSGDVHLMRFATRRAPEIVFVLAPTQNLFFFELAEALRHELVALGVSARIAEDGLPPFASHRVNVL